MKKYRASGAAVVVARDGEIVYELYYGYANKKENEPVTEETYFKLASVTKFVTGISVMRLVEEGRLALDEDISKYLGYEVKNPYARKVPVTLRNLMSHTSSLNEHGAFSNLKYDLRYIISTDRVARGNWYNEKPGSKYRYSNFGAGIMGTLLECATGKNLNDAATEAVFRPMGIDAAYSASLLGNPDRIACSYNADGSLFQGRITLSGKDWDPEPNPDMHFRITAGSLWIHPRDLCRLGMLMAAGGTLDGVTLLKPETVAEMMADQKGRGNVTADSPYGLCVQHETTLIKGKTFYGHQGRAASLLCNVYFDPETQFVFVMCCNGCNNKVDHNVGLLSRKLFSLAWAEFGE